MNALDEAIIWYRQTRRALRLTQRLGQNHWDSLPEDCPIFADDRFKQLDGKALAADATTGLESLDELAIVKLFAAFEALIRERAYAEVQGERQKIVHPALSFAAEEVLWEIRRGSFAKVLDALKAIDVDLTTQVRQIREYRNWISHGKNLSKAEKLAYFHPEDTYIRLDRFLMKLERVASARNRDDPETG